MARSPKKTGWSDMSPPRLLTIIFFLSGGWLMASPYVLDFAWEPSAWWNSLVIGAALIVVAIIRFAAPRRFHGLQWTALILGAWMIASPFVAEYADVTAAFWNSLLIGAIVVFAATLAAAQPAPRPA
jgi:hypothetical protein